MDRQTGSQTEGHTAADRSAPRFRLVRPGLIPIRDLGPLLWRKRVAILALSGLLGIATLMACEWIGIPYSATATLAIEPPGPIAVFQLPVLRKAAAAEGLEGDLASGAMSRLGSSLLGALPWSRADAPQRDHSDPVEDRALSALQTQVSIAQTDNGVRITAAAPSPAVAAQLANAVADAFVSSAKERSHSDNSSPFPPPQASGPEPVQTDAAASKVADPSAPVLPSRGNPFADRQVHDATKKLAAAQVRAAELKRCIDLAGKARHGRLSAEVARMLGSPAIIDLSAREGTLAAKQAALGRQLGPRHPAMISIASDRRELNGRIASELDRIATAARADYARTKAQIADETDRIRRLKAQVVARPPMREKTAPKASGINSTQISDQHPEERAPPAPQVSPSQFPSSVVRIVERAVPPPDRNSIPTALRVLAAMVAGLALGAGGVALAEVVRPTVRSAGQVSDALGLPVIVLRRPPGGLASRLSRSRATRGAGSVTMVAPLLHRVLAHRPPQRHGRLTHGVLLVGAAGGPDKIARHLARIADTNGERVLLIPAAVDASRPGLAQVLGGEAPLEAALTRLPQSGVMMLATGRAAEVAAGWRPTRKASWFFAQTARRFDLMIVDGEDGNPRAGAAPLFADCIDTFLIVEQGRPFSQSIERFTGVRSLETSPTAAVFIA